MTTRVKLRTIAIAISIGYTVIRTILVQATLAGYGINPWLFGLIDLVTGVLYVLGIEQLIVAMRKGSATPWRKVLLWGVITGVSFAAPYIYLFATGSEMPLGFVIGLGVIVALLLGNAALSFKRRVHQDRK